MHFELEFSRRSNKNIRSFAISEAVKQKPCKELLERRRTKMERHNLPPIIPSLVPETSDLALDRLLSPARHFRHPDDVLNDGRLDVREKRAILSSWASDACAVESLPALRRPPEPNSRSPSIRSWTRYAASTRLRIRQAIDDTASIAWIHEGASQRRHAWSLRSAGSSACRWRAMA